MLAPPLDRLAATWIRAHALARRAEHAGDAGILAPFLPLLTEREPHRTRLFDEVRLFVQSHVPIVWGMEVRVLSTHDPVAFEAWPRTIQPFVFELSGSVTMDGLQRDSVRTAIERIGWEGDGWRVIEVFDAERRGRARLEAQLLAQVRAVREAKR